MLTHAIEFYVGEDEEASICYIHLYNRFGFDTLGECIFDVKSTMSKFLKKNGIVKITNELIISEFKKLSTLNIDQASDMAEFFEDFGWYMNGKDFNCKSYYLGSLDKHIKEITMD